MAKSVTLEKRGLHWKTQTLAREHFVKMLHRYKRKQAVLPGSDHDDLLALLEIYDVSGTKRGSGVASFFLDADREYGGTTDCFYVKRTDGSSEDFSVHKAVIYTSQIQNKK
ncbi:MAG: DUF3223 domain-containing protein [Comamonas sp.]|uniref:DUF3223 domain-containing protein n=1 Tax=Comamonas sp. TaxID=34028 RepID=UPI002FCC7719